MNMLEMSEVVRRTRELPTLPSVILDLISTLERPDVDIATLADKISRDQALAAKTLRLANSSFYGMPSTIKTVGQAIVVLGFDSARALVAAGAIIDTLSQEQGGQIDGANFWRHSIAVALCAKNLARRCGNNHDYAFIAGLLHDIGRLVLATRFPAQYAQARSYAAEHGVAMGVAESDLLGIDHQRAGLLLAELWKFPLQIQRAIGEHHRPQAVDLGQLPSVIHVADAIVHALDLGSEDNPAVPGVQLAVWDSLRVPAAQLQSIFRETESQFEEACSVLTWGSRHE